MTCLICDGDSRASAKFLSVGPYCIARCPVCGVVFLDSQLESIAKTSINEQRYGGERPERRGSSLIREDQRALAEISQHSGHGSLLEIGCGDGGFLVIAAAEGWRVRGVEMSDGAARIAASVLGEERIHHGPLETCDLEPESFDVVVMKSVIEHLPNPRAGLASVRRLLRPGGHLYLLTPNIESLDARLYKSRWFALVPGDHLWFFSPATLENLVKRSGFETRWLVTTESYEDVVVAALFALRSLTQSWRSASDRSNASEQQASMGFGLTARARGSAQKLLEASRYISLPWFYAYSYFMRRAALGACIRGVFMKTNVRS